MSALGQLVAGIAHELNNPLGCIVSNLAPAFEYVDEVTKVIDFYQNFYPEATSKLEETLGDIDIEFTLEDLPNLLKSMQISTERIQDISISLRNFSRSDARSKVKANLYDGLESSLIILHHRLKASGTRPKIEVIKNYGDLPSIECYPGLINQVFINILANAIDAVEESLAATPQIQIQTGVVERNVVIRIVDNGVGMPVEVQQKVFNQLFTTKAIGKGTGLGLSIAHEIVEDKHGGKLSFTSEMGKGTEFVIALPIT